jgi:prophage antirepressor-like protein
MALELPLKLTMATSAVPSASTLALAASPLAPPSCSFTDKKLVLDGKKLPFIRYDLGAKDEIWFPAKPVMLVTGEKNISHILNRVPNECKMSLEALVAAKGLPQDGCYGFLNPPDPDDYHQGKALWVDESGFYAMLLGSRNPQCALFQRWVLQEVLPSIRRSGSYHALGSGTSPQELREAVAAVEIQLSATPASTAMVAVLAAPSPATTAPKAQLRALKAPEEHFLFLDVVKERCKLTSTMLKDFVRLAYAAFLNLIAIDEERSVTSVSQELKDATFGLKAIVPQKWLPLAVAAIEASSAPVGSSVPTGDAERAPPEAPSSSRKRKMPFFSESEHALAKDAANLKWLQLVEVDSRLFFLDSWCDKEGLKLRTTSALLEAGHSATKLFSANPDEGIVKQLGLKGVSCHHGTWAESPARKYDGIYLDLCSGSEAYLREQFEVSTMRSNTGCILAWTLTARDFNGEPLILRAYGLHDCLKSLGWKPAMQQHKSSTLFHRSSGSGQQVLTEFWIKG